MTHSICRIKWASNKLRKKITAVECELHLICHTNVWNVLIIVIRMAHCIFKMTYSIRVANDSKCKASFWFVIWFNIGRGTDHISFRCHFIRLHCRKNSTKTKSHFQCKCYFWKKLTRAWNSHIHIINMCICSACFMYT